MLKTLVLIGYTTQIESSVDLRIIRQIGETRKDERKPCRV